MNIVVTWVSSVNAFVESVIPRVLPHARLIPLTQVTPVVEGAECYFSRCVNHVDDAGRVTRNTGRVIGSFHLLLLEQVSCCVGLKINPSAAPMVFFL